MVVDGRYYIGNRIKGQDGAGFTVGFLARVGARGGIRRPGIKVSSDKELVGW